jgi:hypothetical protein
VAIALDGLFVVATIVDLLMGMLFTCDIARTLANMEALFGQLYLVTVIGVLVSRIPAVRRAEV